MIAGISPCEGRLLGLLVLGSLAILLGACGGSGDDLTVEEHMVKLAGSPLTRAEIDERIALADTMCDFDSRVLNAIWLELDPRQLEFQDYVFGQHCPDRRSIYEEVRPDTGTVPDDLEPVPPTDEQLEADLEPAIGFLESLDSSDNRTSDNPNSDNRNSDETTSTTAG